MATLTFNKAQLPSINSTTYIDLIGVLLGLSRMQGESAPEFAVRIRRAAAASRSADYIGLMNELCIQFGLDLTQSISLTGPEDLHVSVDLLGVHVSSPSLGTHFTASLAFVAIDNFWEWRKLSDIVADLNSQTWLTAELLAPDGLAFTLVRQSNQMLATGEAIDGMVTILDQPRLIRGSETFNAPVPAYQYGPNSQLLFSSIPTPGTTITYQYLIPHYKLITCPVFTFGLLDSQLGTLALGNGGQLVYQCQEFLSELLSKDKSYWGR